MFIIVEDKPQYHSWTLPHCYISMLSIAYGVHMSQYNIALRLWLYQFRKNIIWLFILLKDVAIDVLGILYELGWKFGILYLKLICIYIERNWVLSSFYSYKQEQQCKNYISSKNSNNQKRNWNHFILRTVPKSKPKI